MDTQTLIPKVDQKYKVLFSLFFYRIWFIVQTPVQTIASNAGVEGAVIVGKLLDQDNHDLGYDAAKGLVCFKPSQLSLPQT